VCQKLFLNTIGVTCASNIVRLYAKCVKLKLNPNSLISAPIDQWYHNRVKKRKQSINFNNTIEKFIHSKNPQKSHYDLSHSNKFYFNNYTSEKLYEGFVRLENFEPRFELKKQTIDWNQ